MTINTNQENTENRRLESLAQAVQQRIVSIKIFEMSMLNDLLIFSMQLLIVGTYTMITWF